MDKDSNESVFFVFVLLELDKTGVSYNSNCFKWSNCKKYELLLSLRSKKSLNDNVIYSIFNSDDI